MNLSEFKPVPGSVYLINPDGVIIRKYKNRPNYKIMQPSGDRINLIIDGKKKKINVGKLINQVYGSGVAE